MNRRILVAATAALCAFGLAPRLSAAKAAADILPPQRRQAVVDTAERLAQRPLPEPVPAELPNPFNPPTFDPPEPGAPRHEAPAAAGPAQPVSPPGDREILETLAMRLTPSGTIALGGKPFLIIERNRFEVGTKFIVTYNDQDYELELVAIDRTTFKLRYRGEEITRPIKPVK